MLLKEKLTLGRYAMRRLQIEFFPSHHQTMINGSSLFQKSSPTEEIEILDGKEWFAVQPFRQIDLAKIIIESGEYELLDRIIDKRLIEKIHGIQVQFQSIAPTSHSIVDRIRAELARALRPTYQDDVVLVKLAAEGCLGWQS